MWYFLAENWPLASGLQSPSLRKGQCQVQTHGQIIIITVKSLQSKSEILQLWDHGRSECNDCSVSLDFSWTSPESGMHEAFWLTDFLCFWLKKRIWDPKKYAYCAHILRNSYLILARPVLAFNNWKHLCKLFPESICKHPEVRLDAYASALSLN